MPPDERGRHLNRRPDQTRIYHITHVDNLPGILLADGLRCDSAMQQHPHTVIGNMEIKRGRLRSRLRCLDNRAVGEFVPFYFCPRSVMLFSVNQGRTGRPDCQQRIVHLVSTVAVGVDQGRPFFVTNGNARTVNTRFEQDLNSLETLDWEAINARQWADVRIREAKQAEFLVADFFDWNGISMVGCHDAVVVRKVQEMLTHYRVRHHPIVETRPDWYY